MLPRRRCLDSVILASLLTRSSPCCRKYCGSTPQGRSLNAHPRAREGRERGRARIRRGPLVTPAPRLGDLCFQQRIGRLFWGSLSNWIGRPATFFGRSSGLLLAAPRIVRAETLASV